MGVQGYGGRLYRDASILLILTGIRETLFSGFGGGDNAGALDEGIGKGGFSVVDYGGARLV